MGFFDKLNKTNGGYIFISHSHNDIEKVRKIRNLLEKDGFEPLCFYLKCLSNANEIEDLIKREIDAREWFIFVNSENARKSKWVTLEREYINQTDSKKIITVDIDNQDDIEKTIDKILHNLRIYISYSVVDVKLADRIQKKLEEKDYLVFSPKDIQPGEFWMNATTNAIIKASAEGCVIILITEASLKSEHVLREIELAFIQRGNIIPVLVGDTKPSKLLMYYISRYQFYYLPSNPTDTDIEMMVDKIGKMIINKN